MLYDDTMRQSHMSHLIGIYTHVRMYDYKQEIACIQSCEVSGPSSYSSTKRLLQHNTQGLTYEDPWEFGK